MDTDNRLAFQIDQLQLILKELTHKDEEPRNSGMRNLNVFVNAQYRTLTSDQFTNLLQILHERIFKLINGNVIHELLGGILAVGVLIDFDTAEYSGKNTPRFSGYLRKALSHTDERVLLLASHTLGRLVKAEGALTADCVEFEATRALEWLQSGSRYEARRLAAVLILKELAENAPTLFFKYNKELREAVWIPLSDSKTLVRTSTLGAISATLRIITGREQSLRTQWYSRLYEEAARTLARATSNPKVHSALLVVAELLQEPVTGRFMDPHFLEICELVFKYKASRESPIRRDILSLLIPRMAHFSPSEFVNSHLNACTLHLFSLLKKESERDLAFHSLGEVAVAVGERFKPYLTSALANVKAVLKEKKGNSLPAIVCVSMLARAMGRALTPFLDDIVPFLVSVDFSPESTAALTEIGNRVPAVLPAIQEQLLNKISLILDRQSFRSLDSSAAPLGSSSVLSASSSLLSRTPTRSQKGPKPVSSFLGRSADQAAPSAPVSRDDATIALALQALSSFVFQTGLLWEFVRSCVITYLSHSSSLVRKEAVLTCARLLVPPGQSAPTRGGAGQLVGEVLSRLLMTAISDADARIRLTVLSSLGPPFDFHLCQADNIKILFLALNDEEFAIRELAVSIIARLASLNPAEILAVIRKRLISLISELDFTFTDQQTYETIRLLGQLISAAHPIVKPFLKVALEALVPRLRDPSPRIAACAMTAIGQLCTAAGRSITPSLPQILPHIIDTLQDHSSSVKRQAALATLSQLGRSAGYVIQPFQEYPGLLTEILLPNMEHETVPALRRELMKVFGVLGAIDPDEIKSYATANLIGPSTQPQNRNAHNNNTTQPQNRNAPNNNTTQPQTGNTGTVEILDDSDSFSTSSSDYYPKVTISFLMRMLRDSTLHMHHTMVIQALMFIFSSLGPNCVPFLHKIMPPFLAILRTGEAGMRKFMFRQLGLLVQTVKQQIRDFLPEIFELVKLNWKQSQILEIISLLELLSQAKTTELRTELPAILRLMLSVLIRDHDHHALEPPSPSLPSSSSSSSSSTTQLNRTLNLQHTIMLKVLQAFQKFDTLLEDHVHIVGPTVIRLAEDRTLPSPVRKQSLLTLTRLGMKMSFVDIASKIVLPLSRILAVEELRESVLRLLSLIVAQLGPEFCCYEPLIKATMDRLKISDQRYQRAVDQFTFSTKISQLQSEATTQTAIAIARPASSANGEALSFEERLAIGNSFGTLGLDEDTLRQLPADTSDANPEDTLGEPPGIRKYPLNPEYLELAWSSADLNNRREDWTQWILRLSIGLLKESPAPSLRSCLQLAQVYPPLARDLFHAAFVSCWPELSPEYQERLVDSIKIALYAENLPTEILQQLLNLAEFMERDDKPLPIPIQKLGQLAEMCNSFAKSLYYKEIEFRENPVLAVESLISVNNQLRQHDAATGVLIYAQKHHQITLQESWYEKLRRWDDALRLCEQRQVEDPLNREITLRRARCLHALSDWDRLGELASQNASFLSSEPRLVEHVLSAYWHLDRWADIGHYVQFLDEHSIKGCFFRALVSVHNNQYALAQQYIDRSRNLIDSRLTALASESYHRAYNTFVSLQQLAELEEAIEYRQCLPAAPEKAHSITLTWKKRLAGIQPSVETWQRVLGIHAVVLSPQEHTTSWLKFSKHCMRHSFPDLAEWALRKVLQGGNRAIDRPSSMSTAELAVSPSADPQITYHYILLLGSGDSPRKVEATDLLRRFVGPLHSRALQGPSSQSFDKLLAHCYLRLGKWERDLSEDLQETSIRSILSSFKSAIQFQPKWYKAWHWWALMNFEAISRFEQQALGTKTDTEPILDPNPPSIQSFSKHVVKYIVPAISGLFQAISLGRAEDSLQDLLRLLTLWFRYAGTYKEVEHTLRDGFDTVSIDAWLEVIPQLIARIQSNIRPVRRLLHDLIVKVGQAHPQALVYPLTLATMSHMPRRMQAASSILERMKENSPATTKLIGQASLVSEELIRVAITWHEMWHEAIEEASRQYFGDRNVEAMLATLEPLVKLLQDGPKTLNEIAFQRAYGRELLEAWSHCLSYRQASAAKNPADLTAAWDSLCHVFRRLNKQLPQITTLDLQYVSPLLLEAHDLDLAVPRTYQVGHNVIGISFINPSARIISSKQRPRRLTMRGSDGLDYLFLLKGHEDLRQDERVMQLFGLVNTLLQNDSITARHHLSIQRYSVIPLSPNSGLIGWVPNTDTMHQLIRSYRAARKIVLNHEHLIMKQMAGEYEPLTNIQKVEVFQHALASTTGEDLHRILWLKSKNAETWLDRRTNFTTSLAVMSMVGYILGLGDRHPSNLMLERQTGNVIHIDFGDCFEVAMHREKYPEKIPFRLTRMLIYAMEASGIEGTFRLTCERVMRVLREHKESLMAVLEAFVHDPLLNWRLNTPSPTAKAADVDPTPSSSRPALNRYPSSGDDSYSSESSSSTTPSFSSSYDVIARNRRKSLSGGESQEDITMPEVLNQKAVSVIDRVAKKLRGRDFCETETLDIPSQVQRLFDQATSPEYLSQAFIGWCSFW